MKKSLLLLSLGLVSLSAIAQDYTPYKLNEVYSTFISPQGGYIIGQDVFFASYIFNTQTKDLSVFQDTYPGNGNAVSDNGIMVGQLIENEKALIMVDGQQISPAPFFNKLSTINGITGDGTVVCGWVAVDGETYSAPYYMEIDEDFYSDGYKLLPYPETDFFGQKPQYVTAVWISDDANVITGQVMNSDGMYCYPIIFRRTAGVKWTYSLPSTPLVNPNHYPIPSFPNYYDFKPVITQFMTAENAAKWEEALRNYQQGTGADPYNNLSEYISDEAYQEYQAALKQYDENPEEYFDQLLDNYWKQMYKITEGSNFPLGCITMNSKGTVVASALTNSIDDSMSDDYSEYKLIVFKVEDDSYRIINSKYPRLYPKQIFDDGTVLCIDPMTTVSYVLLPDAEEVIPYNVFVGQTHPAWLPWIKKNFAEVPNDYGTTDELYNTGIVSVNRDGSVATSAFAIGYDTISYVFGLENAGIEDIINDITDGKIIVFDLLGNKVLETKDKEALSNLEKGIYIINGKKTFINK